MHNEDNAPKSNGRRLRAVAIGMAVCVAVATVLSITARLLLTEVVEKGSHRSDLLGIVIWLVAVVLGGWQTARQWSGNGPREPAANACSRCAYNLTGNVSGVCPECGTTIPKSQRDGMA